MDSQQYPSKFGARRASPAERDSTSPPPLSENRRELVRELSSRHAELLPEFESFLKELYRCGLIDGRRALFSVERTSTSASADRDIAACDAPCHFER